MQELSVYFPNLLERAKIIAIVKDYNPTTIDNLKDAKGTLIANLEDTGVLEYLRKNPQSIICCISHINSDLIKQAKEAGCTHVYINKIFSQKLKELFP